MKRKIFSILAVLVLVCSFSLVTAVPVAAAQEGAPAIDGVISTGEWDGATSFQIRSYTGYVTNDDQYMYVAYNYAIKTVGEWANIITYRAGLTPETTHISWVFVEETGLEPERWTVEDTHTVTVDGKQGGEKPDGLFTPFEVGTDPEEPVVVDTVGVAGAKKTNLVCEVDSATEMAIPLKELGLTPGDMFPSGGDSIKIMPGINTLPNPIFVYPDSGTDEDDLTIRWSWDPTNYADYTLWVPLYNLEITIAGQGQVTYIEPDTGLVEKSGDGTTWTMSYKAGTWSDVFTAQTWDQYPNWEFVRWTVHTSTDDIISPEPTGAIPIFEDLSVTATFAQGTTCEIVGEYYPVNFTVIDDGPTVTWTFDMIGGKVLSERDKTGGGRWNYGLAISLDGVQPAFQIHNNDGADNSFAVGTHLYSQYLGGWQATIENTPVDELDWVTCTGDAYISPGEHGAGPDWPVAVSSGNPDGIFTVTIDKAELGLEFYWAIWCTAGGFWDIGGYSSYPEGFMWDEDVTAGHYELCSFPANTTVGVAALTEQITAINVGPTSIDFGTITPGIAKPGDDINVTNIGTVNVDVIAALGKSGTVFKYLSLDGVSPISDWRIEDLAGGTTAAPVKTLLDVPRDYSAKGIETNTLIFTARTD